MDEFSQLLGNQWKCEVPNIIDTQEILLAGISFREESHTREFAELRTSISNESLSDKEAECSAVRLVELVSTLPELHIAQVIIRSEAAKTFYNGTRYTEVIKYCEEALGILQGRALHAGLERRYDERLRFDLLELLATSHECDGDDHAALTTWAVLSAATLSAIGESKTDPSYDESAHHEFVEEVIQNLSEGWFSSVLSVPKLLKPLQKKTLDTLMSGVIDAFNSLLIEPVDHSQLLKLRVNSDLVPVFSRVLYLYACHLSFHGDKLSAENLLSHRYEVVKEYSSLSPSIENTKLQRTSLTDLVRTRVDRGAISLATESAKELLLEMPSLSQKELQETLGVIRSVLQSSEEEDIAILAPLIRAQFRSSKFPRSWLGVVGDLVEIAIDLGKHKYARKMLAEINQRVDIDSDSLIKNPVRASLLYSQINCLVKIDQKFRIHSEVTPLAEKLTKRLVSLIESPSKSFADRNFHLLMCGNIMLHSLRAEITASDALMFARRIVQAINTDDLATDQRTLGALYTFLNAYLDLELPERNDQFERALTTFSLYSEVFSKDFSKSPDLDIELISSLAVQFSGAGMQCIAMLPAFTSTVQKVATSLQEILPSVLGTIDSESMTVDLLTRKVSILSDYAEVVKMLQGEESASYKELSLRLESARRALHYRLE